MKTIKVPKDLYLRHTRLNRNLTQKEIDLLMRCNRMTNRMFYNLTKRI